METPGVFKNHKLSDLAQNTPSIKPKRKNSIKEKLNYPLKGKRVQFINILATKTNKCSNLLFNQENKEKQLKFIMKNELKSDNKKNYVKIFRVEMFRDF